MLKLLDQVVDFLIFRNRELIMHNFERLAWLFLNLAIVSATLQACAHFPALIDHGFEHFEVLAGLSIALYSLDLSCSFLLAE